jgi:hypothetical protein
VRGWLAFCAETPILFPERMKLTDVLTHYYFSKVVIHLKEDDWRTAFPGKKMPDHLNWAKYRPALFDQLQREQKMDGSWDAPWTAGAILNTSMALNIFLYENTQIFTLSR